MRPASRSHTAEPPADAGCGCKFCQLIATVRQLRSPGGCPWDADQTHDSLRPNLLEECYEALETLDRGDTDGLKEELGDLLIQVAFHADIAERAGRWDAQDVCEATESKLRRRHPHVFGDAAAIDTAQGVVDDWERIKREEAGGTRSIVASVPAALPSVALASILLRRATRAGLDLTDYLEGSDTGGEPAATGTGDAGDADAAAERAAASKLLATVAAVQADGIDAEAALRALCTELRDRIIRAEELADGTALADLDAGKREQVWRDAAMSATDSDA